MSFNLESSRSDEVNEASEVEIDSEQLSETEETAESFEDCSLNEVQDSNGNEVSSESLEEAEENYDDCEAKMEEMEEENPELADEDDDFNDCGKETEGQYVAEVTYTTDGEVSEEEAKAELQEAYNECDDPEDMQQLTDNANENEHIEVKNAEVIERPDEADEATEAEYEQAQKEMEEAQEKLEAQQDAAQEYKEDLEEQIDEQENEIPEGTEDINEITEETDEATEETDEATEETDEATENTDEATEDTDEATEETDEATEETDEATEETDEATEDTDEATDDADEAIENTDEATEETDEATENTDEATEETDEATENTDEVTEDTDEVTEDTDEVTEETDEVTEETDEVTEETDEVTEETDEATEDADEATEKTDEATEENDEATENTDEATEDTDEATEETDEVTEETDEATENTDEVTEETDEATEETDEATEETDEAEGETDEATENTDEATEDADEATENTDEATENTEDTDGEADETPEDTDGEVDENPEDTEAEAEETPEDTEGETEENPEDTEGEVDENPEDTEAEVDENPEDTEGEVDENPKDTDEGTDENPEEAEGEVDENPEDTEAEVDENPEDTEAEADENPEDAEAEADENPEDTDGEVEENPEDTEAEAEGNPEDTDGEAEETSEDADGEVDENPEDTEGEVDENPKDTDEGTDENPEEAEGEVDENPEDTEAEAEETPEDTEGEVDETPEDTDGEADENPEDTEGEADENPDDAEAEENPEDSDETDNKKDGEDDTEAVGACPVCKQYPCVCDGHDHEAEEAGACPVCKQYPCVCDGHEQEAEENVKGKDPEVDRRCPKCGQEPCVCDAVEALTEDDGKSDKDKEAEEAGTCSKCGKNPCVCEDKEDASENDENNDEDAEGGGVCPKCGQYPCVCEIKKTEEVFDLDKIEKLEDLSMDQITMLSRTPEGRARLNALNQEMMERISAEQRGMTVEEYREYKRRLAAMEKAKEEREHIPSEAELNALSAVDAAEARHEAFKQEYYGGAKKQRLKDLNNQLGAEISRLQGNEKAVNDELKSVYDQMALMHSNGENFTEPEKYQELCLKYSSLENCSSKLKYEIALLSADMYDCSVQTGERYNRMGEKLRPEQQKEIVDNAKELLNRGVSDKDGVIEAFRASENIRNGVMPDIDGRLKENNSLKILLENDQRKLLNEKGLTHEQAMADPRYADNHRYLEFLKQEETKLQAEMLEAERLQFDLTQRLPIDSENCRVEVKDLKNGTVEITYSWDAGVSEKSSEGKHHDSTTKIFNRGAERKETYVVGRDDSALYGHTRSFNYRGIGFEREDTFKNGSVNVKNVLEGGLINGRVEAGYIRDIDTNKTRASFDSAVSLAEIKDTVSTTVNGKEYNIISLETALMKGEAGAKVDEHGVAVSTPAAKAFSPKLTVGALEFEPEIKAGGYEINSSSSPFMPSSVNDAVKGIHDFKETKDTAEKLLEGENNRISEETVIRGESFEDRVKKALNSESTSVKELCELRDEGAFEHKKAEKALEKTIEEEKEKFDAVLKMERGTEEYKQSLSEYNQKQDERVELKDRLDEMTRNQELLEKKHLELRDAQLQKGASALTSSQQTLQGASALNDRYDQAYYESNNKALSDIRSESIPVIKELSAERDAIRQAMDAKMDEISEYVISNNMDRYDTSRDMRYQTMIRQYNELKEGYDRVSYSAVRLDENNKLIAEQLGDEYTSVLEQTKKSEIPEVNNGTDRPKETDYFKDEKRAKEALSPFKPENWERMTVREQKQAVEKLADYNADILGIEDKPQIRYYYKEDGSDYGGFSESHNTIYINEYNLNDALETLDTVSHEYRHKYQHQRAERLENERDLEFKENFEDYIRPEDDYFAYKNQPLEKDARDYAEAVKERINQVEAEEISFSSENEHTDSFEEKNPEKGAPFDISKVTELPDDISYRVKETPLDRTFITNNGERISYKEAISRISDRAEEYMDQLQVEPDDKKAVLEDIRNELIHQQTYAQGRLLGDHGIRHIYGNFERSESYLDSREDADGEVRLAVLTAHVYHDHGYTDKDVHDRNPDSVPENKRRLKGFDPDAPEKTYVQDKDHDIRSREYFIKNKRELYKRVLSEETVGSVEKAIGEHNIPADKEYIDNTRYSLDGVEKALSKAGSGNEDAKKELQYRKEHGGNIVDGGERVREHTSSNNEEKDMITSAVMISDKLALTQREKFSEFLNEYPEMLTLTEAMNGVSDKIDGSEALKAYREDIKTHVTHRFLERVNKTEDRLEKEERDYLNGLHHAVDTDMGFNAAKFNTKMNYVYVPENAHQFISDPETGKGHDRVSLYVIDRPDAESRDYKYGQMKKMFEDMGVSVEDSPKESRSEGTVYLSDIEEELRKSNGEYTFIDPETGIEYKIKSITDEGIRAKEKERFFENDDLSEVNERIERGRREYSELSKDVLEVTRLKRAEDIKYKEYEALSKLNDHQWLSKEEFERAKRNNLLSEEMNRLMTSVVKKHTDRILKKGEEE